MSAIWRVFSNILLRAIHGADGITPPSAMAGYMPKPPGSGPWTAAEAVGGAMGGCDAVTDELRTGIPKTPYLLLNITGPPDGKQMTVRPC